MSHFDHMTIFTVATPLGDADDTSSVKSFSSVVSIDHHSKCTNPFTLKSQISPQVGRRLVISRTFCDDEGREYVRHEVVKNQAVIDAYIRLMQQSSGSKDVRYHVVVPTNAHQQFALFVCVGGGVYLCVCQQCHKS